MAFLFAKASLLGCPEVPPAEFSLDVLTAPHDPLCSRSTLDTADSGGEGVGEVLPDLLKAPPDPLNPGLFPGDDGGVCGSS